MALRAQWTWKSDLQTYYALLRWEGEKFARSWVLRLWLLLTAIAGILLVVVSVNGDEETASQLLSGALGLYLTFGSVVFIILSAGSVASELEVVTDSILVRPVTRYHYILAKLGGITLAILAIYLLVTLPAAYLIGRYHPASDLTVGGVALGVASVAMLLTTLATLGVAVSALLGRTLLAIVVVTLIWLSLGFIFSFLEISYLSPASLLEELPRVVAGHFSLAEQWKIIGSFAGLSVLFSALAVAPFLHKDL
ncbi:MAG: hypothetical protein CL878_09330 [Dehalococcoidia bacterium]|nr:hypothetical protein [Dehalococcoidia bacterium]